MNIHLHNKLNFFKGRRSFGGDILGAAQGSDQHHRGPKVGERSEHFIRPFYVRITSVLRPFLHPFYVRFTYVRFIPTPKSAGKERGM